MKRRILVATTVAALAIVALLAAIRWFGASRQLANSALGAPFVRALNDVRARAYFARDDDCLQELRTAGVPFAFVPTPPHTDDCSFRNVVRVRPSGLLRRPLYMTCRLARAFRRFETVVLQPAAQRYFQQPVAHVLENGVRSCRPVAGYHLLLSEHAFANAIDVTGFVLRDGTEIRVVAGASADARHAGFVREVVARACDVFRTVLGPGFDEQHADHMHLDMGMLGGCRP